MLSIFKFLEIILFVSTLFSSVRAAPPKVLKPSEDSFYEPPDGYEKEQPGTILRIRKSPHKLRSIYLPIEVKNAWQLLVRTTNSLGEPYAIVTTVIEPFNADPTKLVSYQVAEDSSQPDCAPSYSFQYGADMNTIVAQAEMYLMQVALSKGWFVVTPDYEGPLATFTAGKQSGMGTLDSIRATLNIRNITGMSSDVKIALWGYSGGTIPSGWAASLQPSYAPELKKHLIGVAVGGFVSNITATAVSVDGTLFAGLTASAVTGLAGLYPDFNRTLREGTFKHKLPKLLMVRDMCLVSTILLYSYERFFTGPQRYFRDGLKVLQDPYIQKVLSENTLTFNKSAIPDIPVFVFHGTNDTIVPFVGAQEAYDVWCEGGVGSFEFAVDKEGHLSEIFHGSPAAIAWLENRFAGKAPVKGCKRTERDSNLAYPGVDEALVSFLQAAYKSIFQKDVGPNGEKVQVTNKVKRAYSLDYDI